MTPRTLLLAATAAAALAGPAHAQLAVFDGANVINTARAAIQGAQQIQQLAQQIAYMQQQLQQLQRGPHARRPVEAGRRGDEHQPIP